MDSSDTLDRETVEADLALRRTFHSWVARPEKDDEVEPTGWWSVHERTYSEAYDSEVLVVVGSQVPESLAQTLARLPDHVAAAAASD